MIVILYTIVIFVHITAICRLEELKGGAIIDVNGRSRLAGWSPSFSSESVSL